MKVEIDVEIEEGRKRNGGYFFVVWVELS